MQETNPQHTLLLIDGLNIVRRVYEANPAPESPQKVEGAMKSAFGSFRRALQEMEPTYAVAAFDFGGHTWRHDIYPAYRENRKPMPAELREALPAFKERLEQELWLKSVTVPGVEADDVLAYLQGIWHQQKRGRSIVMSTDKDLAWLLCQGAEVRDHFERIWRDADWVHKKFHGIQPHQLHDYLALMGDSVDGVPGVDGIGEKTAAKLLKEHGDLQTMLANAASIKGAVGEKLRNGAEMARISRQLVGFKTDLSLGMTWAQLRMPVATPAPAPAPATPQEQFLDVLRRGDLEGLKALVPVFGMELELMMAKPAEHEDDEGHWVGGTPLALAIYLRKEELAVHLVRNGACLCSAHHWYENWAGWGEHWVAPLEGATSFRMAALTRELMERGGMDWSHEPENNTDEYAGPTRAPALLLQLLDKGDLVHFLEGVGLFRGEVGGKAVAAFKDEQGWSVCVAPDLAHGVYRGKTLHDALSWLARNVHERQALAA